ncbi:hypothetical protein [Donghicola eburneus]|uniref:hypothetical protein n=1 Tax=Donghicola eburneus TaxID=393278 RepID=UPI0008ED594A|nr:hypothetical protein [Donghicola eburneus]SFQ66418.1 hypothetical protein SAMN05421764_10922 [Donghicola eburneus]
MQEVNWVLATPQGRDILLHAFGAGLDIAENGACTKHVEVLGQKSITKFGDRAFEIASGTKDPAIKAAWVNRECDEEQHFLSHHWLRGIILSQRSKPLPVAIDRCVVELAAGKCMPEISRKVCNDTESSMRRKKCDCVPDYKGFAKNIMADVKKGLSFVPLMKATELSKERVFRLLDVKKSWVRSMREGDKSTSQAREYFRTDYGHKYFTAKKAHDLTINEAFSDFDFYWSLRKASENLDKPERYFSGENTYSASGKYTSGRDFTDTEPLSDKEHDFIEFLEGDIQRTLLSSTRVEREIVELIRLFVWEYFSENDPEVIRRAESGDGRLNVLWDRERDYRKEFQEYLRKKLTDMLKEEKDVG